MNTNSASALVTARNLSKRYGKFVALDAIDFSIQQGRIVGLIGPNGAGKTTALRAILGLTGYQGKLDVLGRDPFKERAQLMRETCFIADVAVLPSWLRVGQAVDFCEGVHPRFRRERALGMLAKTQVKISHRMNELSKGMKTQVHLALAMAVDARLLVLDEPTLGLDILARRTFYDALINDYMDESRTILVTTHQVEEIENLLTDVIFIDKGRIVLDASMEDIATRFVAVNVHPELTESARAAGPFYVRPLLGKTIMYFETRADSTGSDFARFGAISTPTVADLFVAKLSQDARS